MVPNEHNERQNIGCFADSNLENVLAQKSIWSQRIIDGKQNCKQLRGSPTQFCRARVERISHGGILELPGAHLNQMLAPTAIIASEMAHGCGCLLNIAVKPSVKHSTFQKLEGNFMRSKHAGTSNGIWRRRLPQQPWWGVRWPGTWGERTRESRNGSRSPCDSLKSCRCNVALASIFCCTGCSN